MSAIVDFYRGDQPDYQGRKLSDIWQWSNDRLESVHDFEGDRTLIENVWSDLALFLRRRHGFFPLDLPGRLNFRRETRGACSGESRREYCCATRGAETGPASCAESSGRATATQSRWRARRVTV